MITVKHDGSFAAEKEYVIDVVFHEFLGTDHQTEIITDQRGFRLVFENGSVLDLSSSFWDQIKDDYLNDNCLPKVTFCENQFTHEDNLPVLFGNDEIEVLEEHITCGIDIFASIFFMISRMEEAIKDQRDEHNRFPAKSSVAYKYGFLERPIVDEYVEMLRSMINHLNPDIRYNKNEASNFITCDVDWPYDTTRDSFKKALHKSAGDIVKRKNFKQGYLTLRNYFLHKIGVKYEDNLRSMISWMMDVNEDHGNRVAFYFITEYTSEYDIKVDFDSDEMRSLFREINRRGHEIGLHPGYECFDNKNNFLKSVQKLKKIMLEEDIKQDVIGGRMHFLRWDIMKTPHLWESAGLDYDTTLFFAESAGFRCGTCKEFTMFDLVARKPFNLKQRPLITMESTIIGPKYENLRYSEQSLSRFKYFKKICHKYNGSYVLLWHNSSFNNKKDKEFYKEIIQ